MSKIKIALILGVRPDIIRLAKFIKLAKAHPEVELVTVSTGQHYDPSLCGNFYEQMELPPPDYQLSATGATPCKQHAALIDQLEDVLIEIEPDLCVFLGDVNAVIGSIVPLKLNIPIVHIEAGMRSFNWDMPEEKNRVIIDRISNRLYCYHENYRINLVREGINPDRIVTVGNIIVDVLREYSNQIDAAGPAIMGKLGVANDGYILITLHRNENLDDFTFELRMSQAIEIATKENLPIVLPVMPRVKQKNYPFPSNFITTEPLPFFDFVALEKNAALILTDSGTVQEEAAYFGVPCLVLRDCTERPETFDSGCVSFVSPYTDLRLQHVMNHAGENVYLGDGYSSERILEDLISVFRTHKLPMGNLIDGFVARHLS